MKKVTKSLTLHRETLCSLDEAAAGQVLGGTGNTVGSVCDTCNHATCRC